MEDCLFFIRVYSALAKAFAESAIVYKPNVASCCCRCETLAVVPASVSSRDPDQSRRIVPGRETIPLGAFNTALPTAS